MIGEGPVGSTIKAQLWFQGEGEKPLTEHREQSIPDMQYNVRKKTSFAECENSKAFDIRIDILQEPPCANQLDFELYVNGEHMRDRSRKPYEKKHFAIAGITRKEGVQWVKRQFQFEEQQTTDDETKVDAAIDYSKLGKIRLEVWEYQVAGKFWSTGGGEGRGAVPRNQVVLEQKGKVSSCVVLSTDSEVVSKSTTPGYVNRVKKVGTDPVQIFEWFYCTEAKLTALQIISHPPTKTIQKRKTGRAGSSTSNIIYLDSSSSEEAEDGEEDEDEDEDQRLFEEFKAFQEFKAFKKRQQARGYSGSSKPPKKKAKSDLAVDLTLSDDDSS